MPKGGKDAVLSKVTFRKGSDWFSKTKQILKNMKTIEERAYEFACKNNKPSSFFCDLEKSYKVGATEQRKEDLEVFCQFLTEYAKMIYWEVESPSSMKPLGEIFRDIVQARLGIVEDK